MPVKRLAALGLLFTLATCTAVACKAKAPAPPQDFDATAVDAAATDAADEGDAGPSQPEAGAACIVYPDILKSAMMAVGGSGTGLAQDATVQQIIKLYGASIPQGGSGTGLCQDASLQALYLLISAQLDAGSGGGGGTLSTITLGGDLRGVSTDAGLLDAQVVNITGAATGLDAGNANQATIGAATFQGAVEYKDFFGPTTVSGSSASTLYTGPALAASTMYSYYVHVACVAYIASDAGGDAGLGDAYNADFQFCYQRVGTASASLCSATPTGQNVTTYPNGLNYLTGASITSSNNSPVVQFGAGAGDNYHCSGVFDSVQVM